MNDLITHEKRMAAVLKLTQAKSIYTGISVEFLMGRNVSVDEVKAALDQVERARAALAELDGAE